MALKVRRGTNAERLGITPAEGELIYTTDTKMLYVGDGTTAGGNTTIANTIDSLLADTTPQLGGNLDLNNHNITGTGNINITGTITATGNINLGDDVGDIIALTGSLNGHLVPDTDKTYNIGSPSAFWNDAYIGQLTVDSEIVAERINASLIADDSTVVFDAASGTISAAVVTGTFTGDVVGNVTGVLTGSPGSFVTGDLIGTSTGAHFGTMQGDLTGSVFADDSSTILDGTSRELYAANLTIDTAGGIISGYADFAGYTAFGQGQITIQRNSASDVSAENRPYGNILFKVDDLNGLSEARSLIQGGKDYIRLGVDPLGAYPNATHYVFFKEISTEANGRGLGVGVASPQGALHVNGSITPGKYADATARDAAITTPANGMMIYNEGTHKFQGYANGAWIDLH